MISWTPTIKQVGVYSFIVNATDGELHSIETFMITANFVPQIISLHDDLVVFATVSSFTIIQREINSEFTTIAKFTSIDPQFRNLGTSSTFTNSNVTLCVNPGASHVGFYPKSLTLGYDNDPMKTARYTFTLHVDEMLTVRASDDLVGRIINQRSFIIDTFDYQINTAKFFSDSLE